MIKTLIAAAVAGAFALPMVAQASAQDDSIVVAQAGGGGDASSSAKQPGANPPGAVSPGAPSTATTGTDRDTGAATRTNPSGATGGTASGFDRADKNRDGFISRDEARDANELNTRFTELDRNNDGKLSREEYDALGKSATGSTSRPAASGTSSMGGVQDSAPTGKGPGAQESATRSTGGK